MTLTTISCEILADVWTSELNIKNLKEMLEKRRTSDFTRESTTGTSDHETERSLQFYSDSYDDLNSFQAKAVRELKCMVA